ncbi:MAG: hypothetical protein ACPGXW_05720 [Synechococcus sp.]
MSAQDLANVKAAFMVHYDSSASETPCSSWALASADVLHPSTCPLSRGAKARN